MPVSEAGAAEAQEAAVVASGPLPALGTPLGRGQVLERLGVASRRGRLPGFDVDAGRARGGLFAVAAYGKPFDELLIADAAERPGGGTVLTFRLHLLRGMPAAFAAVLLLSIWPGVYFMDELVAQFLPSLWRPWVTYWWYLPLSIIPTPWVWRGLMRRSRAEAMVSAREAIGKIRGELGAAVEGAATRTLG